MTLTPEKVMERSAKTERIACVLALVVVGASVLIHSWSLAAGRLRSGSPAEGLWMVSDSLARPTKSQAVWMRYDPSRGLLDMVAVPPGAVLSGEKTKRRAGKEYQEALKTTSDPIVATAIAAENIQKTLSGGPGAPLCLHLDETAAAGLQKAGGGPKPSSADTDDLTVGIDPELRRASGLMRGALESPWGPWGLVRGLGEGPSGVSNLSRYDMVVLALESLGLRSDRIRPVELPVGRRGEVLREELDRLWDARQARSRPILAEVLNGSSKPGIASLVTRSLRERGVDVVYFGNLGTPLRRTWILDRSGDREAARRLRALVPARAPEIWTKLVPEKLLHASILLGDDLVLDGKDE